MMLLSRIESTTSEQVIVALLQKLPIFGKSGSKMNAGQRNIGSRKSTKDCGRCQIRAYGNGPQIENTRPKPDTKESTISFANLLIYVEEAQHHH